MLENVYAKTDKGRDEIATRKLGVSARLRSLLLMMDGQRSIAALASKLGSLDRTGDDARALIEAGLIELVASAPVPQAPAAPSPPAAGPPAAPAPPPAPVSMHDIYSVRVRH